MYMILAFMCKKIDENILIIDKVNNKAYSDKFQDVGIGKYEYIPYYKFADWFFLTSPLPYAIL